jgi:GH15 family glucan-1,4-alpha-glucosidase
MMEICFLFKPIFDYGQVKPHVEPTKNGLIMTDAKSEMILSWSAPLESSDNGINCVFNLAEGERKIFVLSYGEAVPRPIQHYHSERRLAATKAFWRRWVNQLKYDGRWKDMIIRSALTLKLLVYSPTGAIIAAPTTSLPEALNGNRNWDYRYSWIRDSANSLWAFHVLGYTSETDAYIRWLIDNNPTLDLDLRLMYAIDGGYSNLKEVVLSHLEGYRRSRPVRIGNDAAEQLQLDACGYMLDALYFSTRHVHSISDEMYYRFVKPLARHIVERWERPGNGIWEIRNRQEHYVYTKAWCFAGLDRASRIARMSGHIDDSKAWTSVMKKIKAEVMRKGWSEKKKAFVMFYGDTHLDAANLTLPLIGFLPTNNERMKQTIEAIQKELSRGALVYRYRFKDGLKGNEGAFLLCGFWLVACLARLGRVAEAEHNFNELITHANHLGLYSEEVDPVSGEALGNFPQAFSHMGFITAAKELQTARTRNHQLNARSAS